ncbi:hypothetical protein [Bacillus paralicheniformis]|uniref:hypothetical protein n=1 Tax=Bacillus paralicheniformis TaxID=1648923 RepID=UPI00102DCE86|nr:hypothetical protein [Bacillus paralicheniformis]MBL7477974.1 hypothetical protein [Bacillus paralicheniformis]MCW4364883.1 hypothetical protein [Bacillus paralicheniformis]MED1175012.1 hypothetical protein [Bacillus paralicheniformis]RZV62865.1 hypothetical protein EX342_10485 [Bacillus paralicheniformis]BCE05183.1 hypothetical protein RSC1_01340 [Bacillus paralicheniformis]
MLKLKDTILYKDIPTNIQSHLTAPISRETKWGMACFIVLMLDILSILPVLVNKVDFFTFAAVPVAILINIWMIIMNTKSMTGYHHHLQYVRFMGVSFSGTSYCQLITAQKMMVSAIGFHVPLISLSLFIYAAVIFLIIRYYLVVFPDSKKGKRETAAPTRMLLAAVPAGGFVISHAVLRVSESAVYLLMSTVYLLMACLFSMMGVKFIHKYFFIKANQDIIRQHRI